MTGTDDLELLPQQPQSSPKRGSSGDTANGNNRPRPVKKRNRIPVSCNECRRRKLRYYPLELL